jgi:ubiquinone/menaquinone biosynthesis C-methylase UbiE
MTRHPAHSSLITAAAMARIDELGRSGRKGSGMAATGLPDSGATSGSIWALGDYHSFAKQTIWEIGPVLSEAAGIEAGHRVLDVAAGTGNVAIRAALRGAHVVASDITPENFPAGRREAALNGVDLEWVEADAQALPFGDSEFDVVTSAFGAIFAPDHEAVARELLRVCRIGGTIAMANFTPDGRSGAFFELVGRYAPPPPPASRPPTLWGRENHVRDLFGDRVAMQAVRRRYVERAASPEAYRDLFTETFGPAVAIRRALRSFPERLAAFDRDLLDFARRSDAGEIGGPVEYTYDYLLVLAQRIGPSLPE